MIERRRIGKVVDQKLRERLTIREVAGGEMLSARVPMIQRGVTIFMPGTFWMDDEVTRRYPNAKPLEPLMCDDDKVRLYSNDEPPR